MKKLLYILALVPCLFFTSCIDEEQYNDDARGNFEALWRIMDEHYCFFDEKGVDWQKVYEKYSERVTPGMSSVKLFEVLGDMLAELRDGHVNMYASFDIARYWKFHEDYPANLSDTLIRRYMGTDYKIASSLDYTILDDNIAYVRCKSFASPVGAGNLSDMMTDVILCRGMILDLRGNGGGDLTEAQELAARFIDEPTLVGYICHKTGRGHNDFSKPERQELKPSNGIRWHKPCIVLTNRSVFSAANECVKYMRYSPLVTVIGDKTGGGAGMPFESELPNGWGVRFSACPMYDVDMHCTEGGIEPDEYVMLTDEDFLRGRDTIIERAREIISSR